MSLALVLYRALQPPRPNPTSSRPLVSPTVCGRMPCPASWSRYWASAWMKMPGSARTADATIRGTARGGRTVASFGRAVLVGRQYRRFTHLPVELRRTATAQRRPHCRAGAGRCGRHPQAEASSHPSRNLLTRALLGRSGTRPTLAAADGRWRPGPGLLGRTDERSR